MRVARGQSETKQLSEAYREFDHALRIRQTRIGYILALLLMPAGISLDYFVYPQLFWKVLGIRIVCDIALLPCFLLLCTPWGKRHAKLLDKPCVMFPTFAICWMIYVSEGAISPYYAGLNLMVLAACQLMPYAFRECALICAAVLVAYTATCVVHHTGSTSAPHPGILFNNVYFLILTSIIVATACHYSTLRRYEDFQLRHDLDSNNKELAATLKKLQETEVQLVQSEKMNALGKLSAGLLHEVNNPLNFTFMALQIAEQEAEGNESLQDTIRDIGQGMTRIRGVISDLRAFAYPTNGTDQATFVVDEALTTALRLTAHELGDIPVERENMNMVSLGGKSQIVHVFMNLLVNSAQALKKKNHAERKITVSCTPRDGRVAVSVRDNGTGVNRADLPRLLEPFFTTKDVGEGMGLGLSICHTIVKNHGGEIEVTSEEGEWTQVTFDLPGQNSIATETPDDVTPAFTDSSLELAGSTA